MKTFYVYMLHCSDGTYYVGITSNIETRLIDHQTGRYPKSYTAKRRPLELVYFTTFSEFGIAIVKEKQLKKWSRKKKQALIEENWGLIKEFAQCQNETHFRNYKK